LKFGLKLPLKLGKVERCPMPRCKQFAEFRSLYALGKRLLGWRWAFFIRRDPVGRKRRNMGQLILLNTCFSRERKSVPAKKSAVRWRDEAAI
jgi:hypothetical protein